MKYFRVTHEGAVQHIAPAQALTRLAGVSLRLDLDGAALEGASLATDQSSSALVGDEWVIRRVLCLELDDAFTGLYDTEDRVVQRLYRAFEGALGVGVSGKVPAVSHEYGDGGCV